MKFTDKILIIFTFLLCLFIFKVNGQEVKQAKSSPFIKKLFVYLQYEKTIVY